MSGLEENLVPTVNEFCGVNAAMLTPLRDDLTPNYTKLGEYGFNQNHPFSVPRLPLHLMQWTAPTRGHLGAQMRPPWIGREVESRRGAVAVRQVTPLPPHSLARPVQLF